MDLNERYRVIRTLDVEAARPHFQKLGFRQAYNGKGELVTHDEVILASLHKARFKIGNKQQARESAAWLKAHHYSTATY